MHRRKSFYLVTSLVIITGISSLALRPGEPRIKEAVRQIAFYYQQQMKSFDSALAVYPVYFLDSSYALRKQKYGELAKQFKKIEGLFTYFHPDLAYRHFLKTPQFEPRDAGPPFPDNWLFIGPFGIDPDSVLRRKSKADSAFEKMFIGRTAANFRKGIRESNYTTDVTNMDEGDILEALRLQMIRISTMGLGNGDFVIEEAGMPALEGAFESWGTTVMILADGLPSSSAALKQKLASKISAANRLLASKPRFTSFNRMQFLTDYLLPLSVSFAELQKALKVAAKTKFAAVNGSAPHVYASNAFNPDYFAPGEEAYLTAAKAELGKYLFFDPMLSDNNERACASCHKPEKAFTDGNIKSLNFARGSLARNAPTVINAGFQKLQFWDLRAASLEDQLDSVVNNPDEMHSSFDQVVEKINSSEEYKSLFFAAFPQTKTSGIRRSHVKIAIASYERMLTGLNSRFDQYVRGDHTKMNASEINGFNLYMGKAKCGSCHYAPLFNGALPPYFDFTDHRSLGVPAKDTMKVYAVDSDTGASRPFRNPFFMFSFKVPTVRNAEVTGPYMHNGVYKTLEQVVEFYNDAGGTKFTKDMRPGMKGLPFFMILPEKLGLTAKEKRDLVAFIKTLTDTSASRFIPARLPLLGAQFATLNGRKVGGEY